MAICYEKRFGSPTEIVTDGYFKQLFQAPVRKTLTDIIRLVSLSGLHVISDEANPLYKDMQYYYNQFQKSLTPTNLETFAKKNDAERGGDYVAYLKRQLGLMIFVGTFDATYTEAQLKEIKDKKIERPEDVFTPQPRRKQSAICLNGLVAMDIDHLFSGNNPDNIRYWWRQKLENHDLDKYTSQIVLAYISARADGLKIVFKAQDGWGNLIDQQHKMADALGVKVDESCKDGSRGHFVTCWDDILYYNLDLFTYQNKDFAAKYQAMYRGGNSQPTLFDNVEKAEADKSASAEKSEEGYQVQDDFDVDGVSISKIIDAWIGEEILTTGKRHFATIGLACDLRYVVGRTEDDVRKALFTQKWFVDLINEDEKEVERCLSDGMKYEMKRYLPKRIKAAIAKAKNQEGNEKSQNVQAESKPDPLPFAEWGEKISSFVKDYPCMKECFLGLEPRQYAPALFVSGALFGTLMTRCYYHMYHRPEEARRLNYCVVVIGDPGSGKSFATRLYTLIASPIIASDRMANMRINEYKRASQENHSKSDKKKGEGLKAPREIVRIHGARTANGVFIEDMINAVDDTLAEPMHLHLLTFDSELDASTIAQKGGQWIDKSVMELKAFHNEEDNQQYKNIESVSGVFNVYWNFIYTGTPISLNRKVNARNFGSGLFSRLAVIPLADTGYKMMEFAKQSKKNEQADNLLKEWAEKMDKVSGDLQAWKLVEKVWAWVNDQMQLAGINDDRVSKLLVKRVPYYGINVALPFIMMRHFSEWEKKKSISFDSLDYELAFTIMDIQFACQKHFFGKYAEMYFDDLTNQENEKMIKKHDKTIGWYHALPDAFTFSDLTKLTKLSYHGVYSLQRRWVKDGIIAASGKGVCMKFKKVKEEKNEQSTEEQESAKHQTK